MKKFIVAAFLLIATAAFAFAAEDSTAPITGRPGVPTAMDMFGLRIVNLGTPVLPTDGAAKAQVDSVKAHVDNEIARITNVIRSYEASLGGYQSAIQSYQVRLSQCESSLNSHVSKLSACQQACRK